MCLLSSRGVEAAAGNLRRPKGDGDRNFSASQDDGLGGRSVLGQEPAHRAQRIGRRVDEVIDANELRAEHWHDNPQPINWHKTAQEIIDGIEARG